METLSLRKCLTCIVLNIICLEEQNMDFILASFLKEIIVTLSNVSDAKDMLLNTIFAEMLMTSHSKLMYMVKIKEFYCFLLLHNGSGRGDKCVSLLKSLAFRKTN